MKLLKETIVLLLKGSVIGLANIIPGVSGGTLAVVLGIYDRLIEAIANFFKKPEERKKYTIFIMTIFIGAAFAVIFLANVMDFLLKQHFYETMFLFMGLILGGIPAVVSSHKDMRIRTSRILAFVLGMIIILGLSLLAKKYIQMDTSAVDISILDNRAFLMILLSGFLAGAAMIIPGISGSFILVLIGQYAIIITAVKELAVRPLMFMAVGAVAGIMVFSKVIETCLEKIPSLTYYFILGLIFASFYKIFPGIPAERLSILFCLGSFVAGGSISYILSRFSSQ